MTSSNAFLNSFRSSLASLKETYKDSDFFVPHLSILNGKLKGEKIASFGLVAGVTCPGADKCNSNRYCYAQNGRYVMKGAMDVRVENFLSSKQDHFVSSMLTSIRHLPNNWNIIRLHDSGDFYAQDYVNKWEQIIKMSKDKFFYAYTKSLNLDLNHLYSLKNALLIQSEGGKFDHLIDYQKPHAKIFTSKEHMEKQGYIDATTSDLRAINSHKIGLIVHGGGKSRF